MRIIAGLCTLFFIFGCTESEKPPTSAELIKDVSRSFWAEVKYGGCQNPANIMRWKYDLNEGLLILQWKNGSVTGTLSHPRQNQQLTEYQFGEPDSKLGEPDLKRVAFIYREQKFARGNGAIEYLTGDPNTLIYDSVHNVTLENENLLKIEQIWQQTLDTKALFESRLVRYEKRPTQIIILERCE